MKTYPLGNETLLNMISSNTFDEKLAEELLRGVDLNEPFYVHDLGGYFTTYLYKAVEHNHLRAVAFLLEHGADPNLYIPDLTDYCALWELQYIDDDQDFKTRYEMSKLFFRHGADPNIECYGETLYDFVVYKVYNDSSETENERENLLNLYKLLVVYGGGTDRGGYPKPKLLNVDPGKVDEYHIELTMQEDGHYISGKLIDGAGSVLGEL